ncbi:hypothetical protein GWO43_05545 [candidate division KSB1 bacterium]|nr:hypothetical protein [candidate division KSB1 bacterium]NIR71614.1 hypothetical protein [candidate division KSB1 bacterium]NIS23449.1 hypothetical protein [candidate division KSB1 bacterium]NIT70357.1 hypothetical protein [candidate division KSB1 bacterium]NIU24059.1 hypothetical protein [candidate division KSB1 bacterium]
MRKNKNKLFGITLSILIILSVLFLQSFDSGDSNTTTDDDRWPTRRELFRKIREIRKIVLVYGTGNPETASVYRDYAEGRARKSSWLEIVAKPDTAVSKNDIESLPISLIGTPDSNSLLRRVQGTLPINIEHGRISVENIISLRDEDVYHLSSYPNPLNPSLSISVTTGNSDKSIVEFLSEYEGSYFPGGEFGVYRNGERIVLGFFNQGGGRPWTINQESTRNYLETLHHLTQTRHYRLIYHGKNLSAEKIRDLAQQQETRAARLLSVFADAGIDTSNLPKIECHLYETLEDKGLITRNTDLSHFDADKFQVHAIFNDELTGDTFFADAQLLITKLLGTWASPALRDGLAMSFSEGWGKRGYEYWAKLFFETDDISPLNELLDSNVYRRESYLFMRPLAGSFVDFLIREYGWLKFLELYKKWPESGLPKFSLGKINPEQLEKGWLAHLENLKVNPETNGQSELVGFQKGFCYAHEGYQIYNGYLSRKSFESLKKLRSLGTEWISLSPFGYLRRPNQSEPFRFSFGPGSENDESLITATMYARELGMGVMLKPHVLMWGPHWGWPGDVNMESEAGWQKFFKYYYKWIRHYALLAEMYDLDILCIGVELMQTTRDHQDEWRDIIAKIRQIYHGPLVYAANWWQEFEQITFWEELDYIGLNLYYPLSKKDTVTVDDLKKGMSQGIPIIEKVVRKYDKPLLLTEVGFTSTEKPWKTPHERRRDASAYLEHQVMCYQAIFESFWDQDWFHGFYWWKWPTYLEDGGKHHTGFTPNGKPAEKVVTEWYSEKKVPQKSTTSY